MKGWFVFPSALAAVVLLANTSYSLRPLIRGGRFCQAHPSRTLIRETSTHIFAQRDSDKKITRDKEGDYFQSEFDKTAVKDRLPVAYAFFGALSLPFIIGLLFLYTQR